MTRQPLPIVARVSIAAWIISIVIVTVAACPSRDETRKEPDDGAGSTKTGEPEATEAPKPSV